MLWVVALISCCVLPTPLAYFTHSQHSCWQPMKEIVHGREDGLRSHSRRAGDWLWGPETTPLKKGLNTFRISDSTHDEWTWQERGQKDIQREMKTEPDGWKSQGLQGNWKFQRHFKEQSLLGPRTEAHLYLRKVLNNRRHKNIFNGIQLWTNYQGETIT